MKNIHKINNNIYITSDEQAKEGDWCLDIFTKSVFKYGKGLAKGQTTLLNATKKIILTTDQDLIKDGVQAIDDEFLEWFVKNPSCEEVKIEDYGTLYNFRYLILIPQEEPNIINDWLAENGNPEIEKQVELESEETLEEIKLPIGDFIIKNATPTQGADGVYYHYSEVCKLLKLQAERMYSEENVFQFFEKYREDFSIHRNIQVLPSQFEQWFEQFKKK
jgi:hypothetical protein